MHKLILIFTTLLFSTGVFAKGCDEGTLVGRYSLEAKGVNNIMMLPGTPVYRSTHLIGVVMFDGSGNVTMMAHGSTAGNIISKTGSGSYNINADDCSATGNITWNDSDGNPVPGLITDFIMTLDQMDNEVHPNKAYHGYLLATDHVPGHPELDGSSSGTFTKFLNNSKFYSKH